MFRRCWLAGLMIAIAAIATGCRSTDPMTVGEVMAPPPAEPGLEWPFRPASIRVHPLSRVRSSGAPGEVLIEARVEFFDQFGDTTKAYGLLEISLHTFGDGREISLWSADLRDLPTNERHFDDVTRTYRLSLGVAEEQLPVRVELRARYAAGEGRELRATFALKRDG